MTSIEHAMTVHTDRPGGGEHYWLTCVCGWNADNLPNNWDEWVRICETHRFEADQ